MNHGEHNVRKMFFRQLVIIGAIVAVMCPVAALASEKTTAVWSDGHSSALSDEELIRYALASPGPGYPDEAAKAKATGSGLYELRINKAGKPTEVIVAKSSGNRVLDNAAQSSFMKWRFKPAVFVRVRVPVSWAVNRIR